MRRTSGQVGSEEAGQQSHSGYKLDPSVCVRLCVHVCVRRLQHGGQRPGVHRGRLVECGLLRLRHGQAVAHQHHQPVRHQLPLHAGDQRRAPSCRALPLRGAPPVPQSLVMASPDTFTSLARLHYCIMGFFKYMIFGRIKKIMFMWIYCILSYMRKWAQ